MLELDYSPLPSLCQCLTIEMNPFPIGTLYRKLIEETANDRIKKPI